MAQGYIRETMSHANWRERHMLCWREDRGEGLWIQGEGWANSCDPRVGQAHSRRRFLADLKARLKKRPQDYQFPWVHSGQCHPQMDLLCSTWAGSPRGPPPRPAPFARSCCSMGSCLQQDTDLACNFLENRCLETLYPQWRGKVIWGSLAGEPGWGCFLSVAVINCSTKSNLEKDMSGWYF